MLHRWLHINIDEPVDRNAWNLSIEIFWAAILSGVASFNAMFVVRLGASNTDIGLLTSLPALVAILISLPAGRFLQSRRQRKPWIQWSLAIHRTGYLVIALLPLLKFFDLPVGQFVLWTIILNTFPVQIFNIGWVASLAEAVPENRRASFFGLRNIIANVTVSITVFLGGIFLNLVIFPVNYQILYLVGFAASMLSQFFLVRVNAPEKQAPLLPPVRRNLRQQWQDLGRFFREQPAFTRIVRNTFLHAMGLWMAGPLYVLFYVRSLGAEEAWIGLNGTVAGVATIVGFMFWRRWVRRLGEPLSLKLMIVCAGIFPLLVGLTQNLTLILFATALNSLVSAGINLSHFNTFLKVIPEDRRTQYHAIYATLVNVGAFIFPLIGVALTNVVDFAPLLIACGILSIIGSSSFWWWPVQPPAESSPN